MKLKADTFGGRLRPTQNLFAIEATGQIVIAEDNDDISPWRGIDGCVVMTNRDCLIPVGQAELEAPEHTANLSVVKFLVDGAERVGLIVSVDKNDKALPYRIFEMDGLHENNTADWHWVTPADVIETLVEGVELSRFIREA